MSKLELGLGLEVLGFRAAPPLGKTTKGEEYKTQEPYCLVNVCFFCFFTLCSFSCSFFILHLFFALPSLLLLLVFHLALLLLVVACCFLPYVVASVLSFTLCYYLCGSSPCTPTIC